MYTRNNWSHFTSHLQVCIVEIVYKDGCKMGNRWTCMFKTKVVVASNI